jgi:hypothetical protein
VETNPAAATCTFEQLSTRENPVMNVVEVMVDPGAGGIEKTGRPARVQSGEPR